MQLRVKPSAWITTSGLSPDWTRSTARIRISSRVLWSRARASRRFMSHCTICILTYELVNTGDAFASFLLGHVDSAGANIINGVTGTPRWKQFAGYAQDDIKLRRNLTLNLGLRYDLWTPVYDKFNNLSIMSPSLPNPAAGGVLGAVVFAGTGPGRIGTPHLSRLLGGGLDTNNFSPHIGFAYSPKQNLVVRSGFGINFFGGYLYGTGNWRAINMGFTSSGGIGSQDRGVTPAFLLDDGFPSGIIPQPPFINPGYGVGQSVSMFYPDAAKLPYVVDWTFDIQYAPGKNW